MKGRGRKERDGEREGKKRKEWLVRKEVRGKEVARSVDGRKTRERESVRGMEVGMRERGW